MKKDDFYNQGASVDKQSTETTIIRSGDDVGVNNTVSNKVRAYIDELWSIELPKNFVYSKDHDIIDGSRPRIFIAQYDDETVDFESPYSTSFNFTVYLKHNYTNSDTDYSNLMITKLLTKGTALDVDAFEILMATEHVLVCYKEPEWIADIRAHHYMLHILVDQNVYCAQIFFGPCKPLNCKGRKEKDSFIFDFLKTIRYVGEEEVNYDEINCSRIYYQKPLSQIAHEKTVSKPKSTSSTTKSKTKTTPTPPEKVIETISGTVPIDGGELEIQNGTLKKIKGKTKNVIVPKGVVKISASAFKNRQSIERVEIPEGVTEIKDGTFELCSNLKEIKLPSTVSVIGKGVFSGCYKIEKIEIPSDNEYFKMIGDCLVDLKRQAIIKGVGDRLPKDGIKEISCDAFSHCEKCREIVIPKGTETIFNHAFYDCDNITKIIIPESVSVIASSAFVYISKDATFVVDEGNKYYSIVGNCLVDKRNKVLLAGSGSINIPDDGCVTEIASFAIRDFSNAELVIPASIESLNTFSIDLSDDVTKTIVFKNPHVNIEDGAIDCYDEAKLVIVGHRGSSAEKYAKDNDFCFKTLGSVSEEKTARITSASTKTGGVNGNSSKPTQPSKPQAPAKANNGTVSAPPPVAEKTEDKPKKTGCYVATAVYGSYDCPEVWTLRRFRDYSLAASLLGRLFIMLYYTISPTLVKWFGNTKWFKKIWKAILDKMVEKLQRNGFENTPYQDRNY